MKITFHSKKDGMLFDSGRIYTYINMNYTLQLQILSGISIPETREFYGIIGPNEILLRNVGFWGWYSRNCRHMLYWILSYWVLYFIAVMFIDWRSKCKLEYKLLNGFDERLWADNYLYISTRYSIICIMYLMSI